LTQIICSTKQSVLINTYNYIVLLFESFKPVIQIRFEERKNVKKMSDSPSEIQKKQRNTKSETENKNPEIMDEEHGYKDNREVDK